MSTRLRLAVGCAGVVLGLAVGTGVAAAQTDPVFASADADDLAAMLTEAAKGQDICYGWNVSVSDPYGGTSESVGSNFGAGRPVDPGNDQCGDYVEFTARITYTSESSESEDSASWTVSSSSGGPSTADLDSLELVSEEGLVGDNLDVDVANAIAALPQLAADAGIAKPIEATPAAEGEAGDARLTDNPGSDFWRQTGMVLVWGGLLVVAGLVFGLWAYRSSRRERLEWADPEPRPNRVRAAEPAEPEVPAYVPPDWQDDASAYRRPTEEATADTAPAVDAEPPTEPVPAQPETPEPAPEAEPAAEPDAGGEPEPAADTEPAGTDTSDDPDDTEPPATPPKP